MVKDLEMALRKIKILPLRLSMQICIEVRDAFNIFVY